MNVLRSKATSPLAENEIVVAESVTRKPFPGANQKMKVRGMHIIQPGARKK